MDYVNVVYQDVSWTGKQGDDNLLGVLQDLKTRGLIDEILKFEPDLTATAAVQFFCKINRFSHLGRGDKKRIAIVDGTRAMSDRLFGKYFMVQCVKMHHMTYIRKNLNVYPQKFNKKIRLFLVGRFDAALDKRGNSRHYFKGGKIFKRRRAERF